MPALFTRYPVYQIKEGEKVQVILRLESDEEFVGDIDLQKIALWLNKRTEPVLVNLLSTDVERKLMVALENNMPILAVVDVQFELS